MKICETQYCRNLSLKGRKICGKCKSKKYRERNPVQASYINLKMNARRRGKEFTLTLEVFTEFCRKTNYISKKGRASDCYTIDRIDNDKGYTTTNIQILSKEENSRKGTGRKKRYYDWETKYARVYETFPNEKHDDDIF